MFHHSLTDDEMAAGLSFNPVITSNTENEAYAEYTMELYHAYGCHCMPGEIHYTDYIRPFASKFFPTLMEGQNLLRFFQIMLIIFLLEVLGDLKIQLISIVNFYDHATPVKSRKRRLAMLMEPTILTTLIGRKICKKKN